MAPTGSLVDALSGLSSTGAELIRDNKAAAAIGGLSAVAAAVYLVRRRSGYTSKPSSLQLTGGNVASDKIKAEVDDYYKQYNTLERGEGAVIAESEKTAELVDKFYSLVTDLYEWGWGQSFHFAMGLPGRNWSAAEAAHEARLPAILGLAPGKKVLDVGCGVGGPMRTIAAASGGKVVGITINEYQVQRARQHNEKAKLTEQTEVVRGNFLDMPFEDATFDGAYAIEATCHAPKLEQVYGQVYRVLKPGALFATYEWVTTKDYDASNRVHVAIKDEIIIGNGLPGLSSWKEAEEAGEKVGFKLLHSRDIADQSAGASTPWYYRLGSNPRLFRIVGGFNASIVKVLETLRLLPRGMGAVHQMLFDTGVALVESGQLGIFTPMHLLVFQKPEGAPSKAASPAKAAKAKKGDA